MPCSKPLIKHVRKAISDSSDPKRAEGMRAYMKSEMPFMGVRGADAFRAACREAFAAHPLTTYDAWRDTVLVMWDDAEYREERYAAIELIGYKSYRDHRRLLKSLPLYRHLIVTGAWWDLVDGLAAHHVGCLLERHPRSMKPKMKSWAEHRHMWLRRTAILSQLRFKKNTDLDLLYDCIEPSIGSKEFFLRKAIGWALRELAKSDPQEVVRYVRRNRNRLSGLSKREALKGLLRKGIVTEVP